MHGSDENDDAVGILLRRSWILIIICLQHCFHQMVYNLFHAFFILVPKGIVEASNKLVKRENKKNWLEKVAQNIPITEK